LNKLSQQPVKVWQCTNTACEGKDAIFAFHHFPGSAETLVRRGGITKSLFDSILSQQHISQNYQNQLMYDEVIICDIRVAFWDSLL